MDTERTIDGLAALPFGILRFILGSIGFTCYNWIARFVGGVEIQVESEKITRIGVVSLGDFSGLFCSLTGFFAIQINPQFADAYHDRGTMYQLLGKTAEGEADFKKYEELTGQKP